MARLSVRQRGNGIQAFCVVGGDLFHGKCQRLIAEAVAQVVGADVVAVASSGIVVGEVVVPLALAAQAGEVHALGDHILNGHVQSGLHMTLAPVIGMDGHVADAHALQGHIHHLGGQGEGADGGHHFAVLVGVEGVIGRIQLRLVELGEQIPELIDGVGVAEDQVDQRQILVELLVGSPAVSGFCHRKAPFLLGLHFHTALGTDGQHMARAFAQHGIDTGPEGIQKIKGNEGLDGAGKAAAVDTVSAPAV